MDELYEQIKLPLPVSGVESVHTSSASVTNESMSLDSAIVIFLRTRMILEDPIVCYAAPPTFRISIIHKTSDKSRLQVDCLLVLRPEDSPERNMTNDSSHHITLFCLQHSIPLGPWARSEHVLKFLKKWMVSIGC